MRLSEAQRRFKDILLEAPDKPPKGFSELFATDEGSLPERLQIYRNNVVGGLTKIMLERFPVLLDLVGAGFLESMARSYVLANPPREGNLNSYGAGFDEFIRTYELAKAMPYLPDVAKFELAMNAAYYAADDEALTAEDLAKIATDALPKTVLGLRGSVFPIDSRWPLKSIRDFCFKKNRAPDEKLDIGKGGERLMIYRPGLDVKVIQLDESEYAFLREVQAGMALGESVAATLEKYPAFDFRHIIQRHIGLGTFADSG